jgi:hypothetical protein
VDRRGLVPGEFGEPLGGPTGRRDQDDLRPPGLGQLHHRADGEAFAASRPAGQHGDAGGQRKLDRLFLLGRQYGTGVL